MQLISSRDTTEKQALAQTALSFGKGLIQPLYKTFAGAKALGSQAKKVYGAATNNRQMYDAAQKSYQQNMKDRATAGFREGTGLNALFNKSPRTKVFASNKAHTGINAAPTDLASRAGRVAGGLGLGSAMVFAPGKAMEYWGASSVNPEDAALWAAHEGGIRANQHMQAFKQMPFMQRMQAAINPEAYTQNNILNSSPEYADLDNAYRQGVKDPGFLKYLSAMHPVVGTAFGLDPVRDAVRYQTLESMKNASEMQKEANGLLSAGLAIGKAALGKLGNPLPHIRAGWQTGRLGYPASYGKYVPNKGTVLQEQLGHVAHNLGKEGFGKTLMGAGMQGLNTAWMGPAGLLPLGLTSGLAMANMLGGRDAGRAQVFDAAAANARGLADATFANEFTNANPLMRMGGAAFPGLMEDQVQQMIGNLNAKYSLKNNYNKRVLSQGADSSTTPGYNYAQGNQ